MLSDCPKPKGKLTADPRCPETRIAGGRFVVEGFRDEQGVLYERVKDLDARVIRWLRVGGR